MKIKVTKMHGCGNDFVIVDYEEFCKTDEEMSKFAKKICDRHFGIGADGLIIPNINAECVDIGWFFYNSDGTTAQMCGNGMRCFAKYVYDKGLVDKKEFTVKTLAGVITPKILENGLVKVNMGKPILNPEKIPFIPVNNIDYKISIKNRIFQGCAISMGNPHFVIFIKDDEDLEKLAREYGPEIELAAEFPEKTNVEFVKIKSREEIELCVWERGCGITLACGTGACASVVAGILNGYLDDDVDVKLMGGKLNIVWDGNRENPDKNVYMSGSAKYVFEAELNL